ncbi:p21-activated protein kinase-interacting protein 1-like [Bradysia coprophila]|uniref:p21-activated protein kinase-interacting protein 1-like n=1 Tax=Bradysia coprophila TaxID=38358 RepID=UPI00187D9976|nr:p21-activated protein kinase-interacting protein 1-like [Bradysia coprophila]
MATDIEIFIGTSQDFLLSFKVKKTDKEHVLERYIVYRCHNGPIISMDTRGRYLATGGGDERIVVVDLKLNRDVHEIICHEGTINTLSFTNKGNDLLSGSEDGRLVATTVGSWKPTNTWKKPHTGKSVLKVCLHPSDKFALSVGKDGTLRGWDMFKGTQMNTFNTKDLSDAAITLDNVELSPDGIKFAMSGEKTVTIISLVGEEPYDEPTLKSRVTSLCWLDSENLLIGLENGSIEWLNVKTSEQTNIPGIHNRRIKGMHCLNGFLGTICTSGAISLWSIAIPTKTLTLICTADEGIRPTCIKLIDTTKNRYESKHNVDTEISKESLPRIEKNLRLISTTGKVIVENNENSVNQHFEQEFNDDDTDTEIVLTPKKSIKRKKSSVTPTDVAATFTPTGDEKLPKRKKSCVTPTDVASTSATDGFKKETVAKKRNSLSTSIVASPHAKVPKIKKAAPWPMDVSTIETEQSEGKKRKSPKITIQKPIVVRSPNSDDDFEQPKTKRSQKKKKSIGKSDRSAVKQKLETSSDDSYDIIAVSGSQKKLNLSLPTPAETTPIQKKKIKAKTPMSCPPLQQKPNSQQSKKKGRALDFDSTEQGIVTRKNRKNTM